MGAVPFQDAKWALLGKRVMSPTSTSSRAAPDGPMPCRSSRAVPVASTSSRELLVRGLLPLVDPFEVGDQFGGDTPSGLAGRVARTDPGQQRLGLRRGEVLLRPARDQLQQQLVQLGRPSGCGPRRARDAGRPASAAPRAARRRRRGAARPSGCRPARPSAHRWRRSCGPARSRTPAPAPTASAARRSPARRRRAAGARRAGRCRCSPRSPRPARDRCRARAASRGSPARRWHTGRRPGRVSSPVITSIVTDRLCGSIPITTAIHLQSSLTRSDTGIEPGGHRYFELSNPLLSHSRPGGARATQANESHTTERGQPM